MAADDGRSGLERPVGEGGAGNGQRGDGGDGRPWPGGHRVGAAAGAGLVVAGLALVVVGSFGPWVWSGRVSRSSYRLLQVADRLGFLGDGAGRWLPRTWVFVPLAAALALGALVVGRTRLAGTVAVVIGVYGLVLSLAVRATPLPSGWGTILVAVGGSLSVVGGVALAWAGPGKKEGRAS